jgi:hypothetical protein
MDSLDYDTTSLILKQLTALERLKLNNEVFKHHKPNQFQVSSELIASKELRGIEGLMMRAISKPEQYFTSYDDRFYDNVFNPCKQLTEQIEDQFKIGNYEPCVQVLVLMQKKFGLEPWSSREDTREDTRHKDIKLILKEFRLLGIHIFELKKKRNFQVYTYIQDTVPEDLLYGGFTGLGLRIINDFLDELIELLWIFEGTDINIDSDTDSDINNDPGRHTDSDIDSDIDSDTLNLRYLRRLHRNDVSDYYCRNNDSDSDSVYETDSDAGI